MLLADGAVAPADGYSVTVTADGADQRLAIGGQQVATVADPMYQSTQSLALGITKEAKATAAVLGYNFPGSEWYQYAYNLLAAQKLAPEADNDSWIGSVWHTVF